MLKAALLAFALLVTLPFTPAGAQAPSGAPATGASPVGAPAPSGAGVPASPDGRLEAAKAVIDSVETALKRDHLSDARLAELRAEIDPVAAQMQAVAAEIAPRLDAAKARLAQFGAKPPPGSTPETPEVSSERANQEKLFNDLDATAKRARVLAVLSTQISDAILARRRALFAHALFARSTSLASPALWIAVARDVPADLRAVTTLAEDWATASANRLATRERAALVLALLLIAALYVPAWRLALRIRGRAAEAAPTRLDKAFAASRVAVATAAVPIAAVLALGGLVDVFELPNQLDPIGRSVTLGVAAVALLTGLARGLLAPKSPNWRLPALADGPAKLLYHLAISVTSIVALFKVIESVEDFISATLPTAVATRGVGSVLVSVAILNALHKVRDLRRRTAGIARSARFEHWAALSRSLSWAIAIALLGAVAIGYMSFATSLTELIVEVAVAAALLYLALIFADEGIAAALKPNRAFGRWLTVAGGLRPETLDQAAVLLTGMVRVGLYGLAVLLVLGPWQVQSGNLVATLEAAFFGFTVGDITISLSTILVAMLLFAVVLGATRAFQRWLEIKFLPRTRLDTGLRNSLTTSLGYIGFSIALALALAHLGLSFERLTLVAGALSVGIGFGLQSVVNNFVSGLILLWERAIRVGDWIVVGEEQGYVRRINVRSTEIETFDRALVIMPNSSLITGVVKNWVRNDRVGRIKLPFTLPLSADPEEVRELLITAAKAHDLVLPIPVPQVFFTTFNETVLRFDLVCFIDDVEGSVRVTSDLLFAIHAAFKATGLVQPPAPPLVSSPALDKLDAWLSEKTGANRPAAP